MQQESHAEWKNAEKGLAHQSGAHGEPYKHATQRSRNGRALSSEPGKDRTNTQCRQMYGAPFVKILYLTDLAQKLLSLRRFSYLCADLAISAHI